MSRPLSAVVRKFYSELGPGLITGAADDDPSGIGTYSVAGARFGFGPLWTALFSFPLMVAVQLMCARLGLVTGRGLAAVVRLRYPRYVLWTACLLLVIANTINIGADLAGMAAATRMVAGIPTAWSAPVFALLILVLLFAASYRSVARVFKWLTLVLLSYVAAAFITRPAAGEVLRSTLIPHIEWSGDFWAVIVGLLGTTISPYLFFWQAAEEVEEVRAAGRTAVGQRQGATCEQLAGTRRDVIAGMFLSNVIMYFIILTTAATLHAHGIRDIETAEQAAAALRPLAGPGAYWLFTLGLIGTGMLGVPVLAGSSAYAISEALHWGASLDKKPFVLPKFYSVLALTLLLGLALQFAKVNAVKMLFWSAVINGVLAPPLIVLLVLLTSDPKVMGEHTNPPWLRSLGWLTAGVMTAAAVAMVAFP
ncbi:MAG TPA: divalent metal cation transporter [Bryobacteraceae bacterium]|nr:divalent metal cation transporter [Bryobacteraceae bacterium]